MSHIILRLPEDGDFEALHCQPRLNFDESTKFDLISEMQFWIGAVTTFIYIYFQKNLGHFLKLAYLLSAQHLIQFAIL